MDNHTNKNEAAGNQRNSTGRTAEKAEEEQVRGSKKSAFNERNPQAPELMNENELNPLDTKEDDKTTGAAGI